MKSRIHVGTLGALFLVFSSVPATADTIYANNATFGAPYVYQLDSDTMTVTNTFTNLSSSNGRGVVIVGDTMYYTTASSGSVFSYTLSTMTDHGVLFTTPQSAIATVAFDGTNFWLGDYSGSNQAFKYSAGGTLLSTITLGNCAGFCDGLEYFEVGGQGRLISNRGDAAPNSAYDVYDTAGNLLQANFIATGTSSTGIAFDGTNFLVSDIFQGQISTYNGITGAFIGTQSITGFPSGFTPLVEDLSLDYNITLPPPPPPPNGNIPEPASLLLLGSGLVAAGVRRRFKGRA